MVRSEGSVNTRSIDDLKSVPLICVSFLSCYLCACSDRVVASEHLNYRRLSSSKARARLEKELTESVNATCDSIWTQLEKNLDRLIKGKIDLVLDELTKIEDVIESLATTQVTLADSLREELRSLNMTFTNKIASAVFGEEEANKIMEHVTTAARIPGVCTLLSENSKGATDKDFMDKLSNLISEDISIVTTTEDKELRAIWKSPNRKQRYPWRRPCKRLML